MCFDRSPSRFRREMRPQRSTVVVMALPRPTATSSIEGRRSCGHAKPILTLRPRALRLNGSVAGGKIRAKGRRARIGSPAFRSSAPNDSSRAAADTATRPLADEPRC